MCMESDIQSAEMHCCVITGTYVVSYMKHFPLVQDRCPSHTIARNKVKKARQSTIKLQPEYGLHVLAGGTVGSMFRLYKKNKDKYEEQSRVLKCCIIKNKDQEQIVARYYLGRIKFWWCWPQFQGRWGSILSSVCNTFV